MSCNREFKLSNAETLLLVSLLLSAASLAKCFSFSLQNNIKLSQLEQKSQQLQQEEAGATNSRTLPMLIDQIAGQFREQTSRLAKANQNQDYLADRSQASDGSNSNCNSLSSCINQLVMSSRLIKEPVRYFMNEQKSELASSSILEEQPDEATINSEMVDFQLESKVKSEPSVQYNPIVFVPGDGGSQLEARLNKTSKVHYFCSQQSDWYSIWLNIHLLAPLVIDCFYDNFRLHYNASTRLTENTAGVEIRARNFGQLDPVAYLDPLHMPKTDYFETIIGQFERENSLIRDLDMFGASFDFRKAPNELDVWLKNLTSLIEAKYLASQHKSVTLICHSMGCLNAVYLLNQKTPVWKQLFVKRLVALAAPWGGSFKAISAMLFGDTLGIPLLDARKLRLLQASWPSLMYLFPREVAFASDQTLVQTPDFNYTLSTLDGLFAEANMTDQRAIWHQTRRLASSLRAPQVELWCLAGTQVATPVSLSVSVPLQEAVHTFKYEEQMGDGDGTVNIESSDVCKQWAQEQQQPVYLRKFPGIDHISMARDSVPAKFISSTILPRDLVARTEPQQASQDNQP